MAMIAASLPVASWTTTATIAASLPAAAWTMMATIATSLPAAAWAVIAMVATSLSDHSFERSAGTLLPQNPSPHSDGATMGQ